MNKITNESQMGALDGYGETKTEAVKKAPIAKIAVSKAAGGSAWSCWGTE